MEEVRISLNDFIVVLCYRRRLDVDRNTDDWAQMNQYLYGIAAGLLNVLQSNPNIKTVWSYTYKKH